MIIRRKFLQLGALVGAAVLAFSVWAVPSASADSVPGGTLDPNKIRKYVEPLVIPPEMPFAGVIDDDGELERLEGDDDDFEVDDDEIKYYEIEVVQFDQQILPSGYPMTTVWSYAAVGHPETRNYPAFTVEAKVNQPIRVKWVNNLVDENGHFLPHLLPVDQTLHWSNPPQDCLEGDPRTDCAGENQDFYTGPVPIVTHVHGAHVGPESDGYPEAWWLPAANNIRPGFATEGSLYDDIFGGSGAGQGFAVFQYPNDQRPTTLWYHDHSLGITRLNVYAGPAGFWLIRGGEDDDGGDDGDDENGDDDDGLNLPGPAPKLGDPPGKKYFEIPIVIQDRSFNEDGSLFYPDNRDFFEGLKPGTLASFGVNFIPDDGSDVPPIWNPEAFFNTMVVNGRTWPYLDVEPRKYRFRFLNGCNSRFLILKMSNDMPFWQIGAEGGFLPAPVQLNQLLMAPAERADVIVDFTSMPVGTTITLLNLGPDEPFGGGVSGVDFAPADPGTTGQVMQFQVVRAQGRHRSTPPERLVLPALTPLGPEDNTRQVSLNEEESATERVCINADEEIVACGEGEEGVPFGPIAALLGTVNMDGTGNPLRWGATPTENPALNSTEMWEIHNFTEDAHPIHLHLVQFQVVGREPFGGGTSIAGQNTPLPSETGFKDTVIAYPGEVTRVKAKFDIAGLYVWHCHILEHEDNEMMRPYRVGP